MHALLNALATQLAAHLVEVEGVLLALVIAFIFAWPENVPHCFRFIDPAIWKWARDTFQGAVPMKFQVHQPPNPTQAHDAPKEQ